VKFIGSLHCRLILPAAHIQLAFTRLVELRHGLPSTLRQSPKPTIRRIFCYAASKILRRNKLISFRVIWRPGGYP